MLIICRRRWLFGLGGLFLFSLGGWWGRSLAERPSFPGLAAKPVIVVDPGHGGIDGGCQDGSGRLEKNLNLAIARRLASRLAKIGTIRLTRSVDRDLGATYEADLAARLNLARREKARLLVSLHANWFQDPAAEGAVAVIPPAAPDSGKLARAILARLAKVCSHVNPEPMAMDGHPLLAGTPFPIVLIEVGFLSNPAEAARLQTKEYQDILASAMAAGIKDYLGPAHPRPDALPAILPQHGKKGP